MVRLLLTAVLILITGGLYFNSFPGSFHYDDFALLLENPVVTGDVFPFQLFLDHHWGRPFTLFSFHWDYQLFGENPFFFHLVNVCLHLLVVILLYTLVRKYFAGEYLAFSTALIFAVHPIQSQAVNYVWSRSVLLMAVFVLLCLLFFRRYPLLGLVFFQLAVWSRAEALLLAVPLLILVPGFRKAISLIAIANIAMLTTYLWLKPPEEFAWTHSDPLSFWLAAPVVFWKYVGLMFWPSRLTIDHPYFTWTALSTLTALSALTILVAIVAVLRRWHPWLSLGVSWILLFLAPSLLIPNGDLVNESRSYLAFAGFAFLVASVIERIGFGKRREMILVRFSLLPIVCLLFTALTFGRNEIWQDEVSLWEEATRYSPAELRPRYNLAVALVRSGRLERAGISFEKALELSPFDDLSYAGLGYCAESRGDRGDALSFYETALLLNPKNAYARSRIYNIEEGDLYR